MIQQMSAREKVLATIVGAIAFLFLNFIVLDYFRKNQTRLRGDLARNTGAVEAMKMQLADRPMWEQRSAWLTTNLAPVGDEIRAGEELRNTVNQLAAQKSVQLVSNTYGVPAALPEYTSVSVQVEATGTWPAMVAFLHELQGPGKSLVFENLNLKKSDKDDAQYRANFKLGRWFAPKARTN